MIMLYMYYVDLLLLQIRYTPWIMLRYVGLLWFGLANMTYLAGRILKMTSKMIDYSSWDSPYGSDEERGVGHSYNLEDTLRSLIA